MTDPVRALLDLVRAGDMEAARVLPDALEERDLAGDRGRAEGVRRELALHEDRVVDILSRMRGPPLSPFWRVGDPKTGEAGFAYRYHLESWWLHLADVKAGRFTSLDMTAVEREAMAWTCGRVAWWVDDTEEARNELPF